MVGPTLGHTPAALVAGFCAVLFRNWHEPSGACTTAVAGRDAPPGYESGILIYESVQAKLDAQCSPRVGSPLTHA